MTGTIPNREVIDRIFDKGSVEEIISALKKENTEWSNNILKKLSTLSPTSLKVIHRQLTIGKNLNLEQCLAMELRIATQMMVIIIYGFKVIPFFRKRMISLKVSDVC